MADHPEVSRLIKTIAGPWGLFSRPSEFERERAESDLKDVSDKSAIPALIQALEHSDYRVCVASAQALGNIGDNTAVPALIKALSDEDYVVSKSAMYALVEMSHSVQIGDGTISPEIANGFLNLFSSLDLSNYDYSFSVADQDKMKRTTQVIVKLGGRSVVPVLVKALSDSSRIVRFCAAAALGELRDRSAVPALFKSLTDSDHNVRDNAAAALVSIGDKSVVPSLIEALTGSDYNVHDHAAWLLGVLDDKSLVPAQLEL